MGRVFLIIKYVSGLCGFQLYGTGVKSSILQQPRAQEFVEDLRRNLLLQCCEILLDQLAPTRSFRLLPLLVICFETFALCLKNVCMCKTIQICSFHSVVLQQEGQAELLFHLLPKKISLWSETLPSCSVSFHEQPKRKAVFQIPELFIVQPALYL